MMNTVPLYKLARTIRSKNAGAHFLTMEIIFANVATYRKVKESGALTWRTIARAYGISEKSLHVFTYFDPGLAVKVTIRRSMPSGGPGESDVYGCQQYAPLMEIPVPWTGDLPEA